MKLNRSQSQEPKTHLRTLPSLKKLYDEKVKKILEEVEHIAEERQRQLDEKAKLHKKIEEELVKRKERLKAYKEAKNTDGAGKHFAKAIEEGCLEIP